MGLHKGVLELKNAGGTGVGIRESGKLENGRDVGLILGAKVAHVLALGQVIFAIRQLQSALQQIGHIVVRIIEAGGDPQSKKICGVKVGVIERVNVRAQAFTEGVRQFAPVTDGSDRFEVRAQRREAFRLDGGLVHVGAVEVSHLAGAGALGRVGFGDLFNQPGRAFIAEVAKLGKDAHPGAIRGNLSSLDPFAVGVLIEIVARLDRAIDVGEGDAVQLGRRCILRVGGHDHGESTGCYTGHGEL
jgi:hypothetical protein